MTMRQAAYLDTAEAQLFTIYHAPAFERERSEGVLICPPAPYEVRRSHRALRNLAQNLAKAGYHVLRLDYRGTGDSSGTIDAWSLDAWKKDIQLAAERLKQAYGVERLSLVGLRLGASLGWQAMQGTTLKRIVLWDPIFDGKAYLDQLTETHRSLVEREADRPPFARQPSRPQLLGFALSPRWEKDLQDFRLELPEQARGVIVQSHDAIGDRSIGLFKRIDVADDQQWANPLVLHIQSFAHPSITAIELALEGKA